MQWRQRYSSRQKLYFGAERLYVPIHCDGIGIVGGLYLGGERVYVLICSGGSGIVVGGNYISVLNAYTCLYIVTASV